MVVSLVQIPWAQALRPYAAQIIDPKKCSFVTPAQAGAQFIYGDKTSHYGFQTAPE